MKKIKQHLIVSISMVVAMMTFAPVAMAQPSCTQLLDAKETSGWIITVLEEQIGGKSESPSPDTVVIDCMRVTETKGDTTESKYAALGTCPPNSKCQRVQVFLAKSGAGLLYSYISIIYKWAAGVIGVVSVLFLVWGGVEIATAGDNTGKIDTAKQRIIQSIAGLVLLFLSAVILYTINPNFFTA